MFILHLSNWMDRINVPRFQNDLICLWFQLINPKLLWLNLTHEKKCRRAQIILQDHKGIKLKWRFHIYKLLINVLILNTFENINFVQVQESLFYHIVFIFHFLSREMNFTSLGGLLGVNLAIDVLIPGSQVRQQVRLSIINLAKLPASISWSKQVASQQRLISFQFAHTSNF